MKQVDERHRDEFLKDNRGTTTWGAQGDRKKRRSRSMTGKIEPAPYIFRLPSDIRLGSDRRDGVEEAKPSQAQVSAYVVAAQRGERAAFEQLYRLYHDQIFRFARSRLGDEGAEDAVSETFLKAWTSLGRYSDRGKPFVAWLYGIAKHVAADFRHRTKSVDLISLDESNDQSYEPLDLAAAISQLSKRQQQVIELKFMIGLTNEEIASVMRTTAGAVNALSWRGLQRLKELLEG